MRISTSLLYQQNGQGISTQQTALYKIQQQISSGTRVLTPADDPIAAANALQIKQSKSITEQFNVNIRNAQGDLGQGEVALGQVSNTLTSIRELVVSAGNAALADSDRASIAEQIDNNLQQLIGLANTRDANGRFLFSGFQDSVQPFANSGGPYLGDEGQRSAQVGPTRFIGLNASGGYLFDRVPAARGVYETRAAAANTGTVSVSSLLNVGTASTPSTPYQIRFTSATTFNVEDITTPGSPVVVGTANQPYASGGVVTIDGKEVKLVGTPASGDVITVTPAATRNIFAGVQQMINALRTPTASVGANLERTATLEITLTQIDQALNRTLEVQTSFGARLSEIETLTNANESTKVNLSLQLNDLVGLDYAEAISELNSRKTVLEAAQQSFVRITGLSLFSLLR
ncbi:flagellar hook-associated protein FlgL [Parvibium lacunae]|nr:flagellar hook-associated protein FlgL [Parvibium lacunae]